MVMLYNLLVEIGRQEELTVFVTEHSTTVTVICWCRTNIIEQNRSSRSREGGRSCGETAKQRMRGVRWSEGVVTSRVRGLSAGVRRAGVRQQATREGDEALRPPCAPRAPAAPPRCPQTRYIRRRCHRRMCRRAPRLNLSLTRGTRSRLTSSRDINARSTWLYDNSLRPTSEPIHCESLKHLHLSILVELRFANP